MPVLPSGLRWLPWKMIFVLFFIEACGVATLYSAAGGDFWLWAGQQSLRILVLTGMMFAVAFVPISLWMRLAYPAYALSFLLLIIVELFGRVGMGAQRWIDLGVMKLQPSELMKIAVVLALARFYKKLPPSLTNKPLTIGMALAIIFAPAGLVLLQPDLGTAVMIIAVGVVIIFMAGTTIKLFLTAAAGVVALAPLAWASLHDYQKNRVLTFIDPDRDPLGQGYHITQSKIAIGSGGLLGKGFLNGSQSNLSYLPEAHTDFIFATMAEEWGMVGAMLVLLAYAYVIRWGSNVGASASRFDLRLVAYGLSFNLFLYVAINVGMVMGLLPVVGVPLPLMSYGGSAIMTVLLMLGILLSVHRHESQGVNGQFNGF